MPGTANTMHRHSAIQVKTVFIAVFPDWLERFAGAGLGDELAPAKARDITAAVFGFS
jgi:hypothetical protein